MTPLSDLLLPGKPWRNWFGENAFVPTFTAEPRSEDDVRQIVIEARKRGLPVRPSGLRHSLPAVVPTHGVSIDFQHMAGVTHVDGERLRVTIEPGISVGDLSRFLRTKGMSLSNQGDIDTQSVCGAIATGTHGAGITLACLSAHMVGARIVTADGSMLDLSAEKDGELFKAFRVSLGLFGIVVSMTIQAVPSYNLLEASWNGDAEDCIGDLHQLLDRNRTFIFFWMPKKDALDVFGLPRGPDRTSRDNNFCHMRTYNASPTNDAPPKLGVGERYDHSSVIYPHLYEPNYREMEYAVPFARFEETFDEIRRLRLKAYPDVLFPLECRPVKADDSYVGPYGECDGYAIGVTGPMAPSTWRMLYDVDAIFEKYDGRPHWGKHHFMTPARLEKIYPRYGAFKKMRREMDPDGVFLNDHLRGLFG